MAGWLRRVIRRVRPGIRRDVSPWMAAAIAHRGTRRLLNEVYMRLGPERRSEMMRLWAPVMRDTPRPVEEGPWRVRFAGREFVLPIGTQETAIDWSSALAISGADQEVKSSYAALLRGGQRPQLFYDVGANFGTHTLLMRVHGVRCVAFEPNPRCHGYLRRACAANGLEVEVLSIALGEAAGQAVLSFPPQATWLGSIDDDAVARYRDVMQRVTVPVRTLDDVVEERGDRPDLIKIDAEGSEAAIVRGGTRTLTDMRPTLLVEVWPERREALHTLLSGLGYGLYGLPLVAEQAPRPVEMSVDAAPGETNFAAIPSEVVARGLLKVES